MNVPRTAPRTARLTRAASAAVALAALATACGGHHAARAATSQPAAPGVPGQVHATGPDVDLTITHAVAHLDASGSGTLTMTVHNGSGVPEHLDMVATRDGGRAALTGGAGSGDGSMTGAGILLRPDATVTFAAPGPTIRFTHAPVAADHTLPLLLEFGVARLVKLSAVVSGG